MLAALAATGACTALAAGCSSSSDATPAGAADAGDQTDSGAQNDSGSADDANSAADAGASGPITGAPNEQWLWAPVGGAKCRDGSDTGIGVNINPGSTKLMIFLEGGGACFNALTCAQNPSSFGESDFGKWAPKGGAAGIFNRSDAASPVKDWSFVYVPYCTGDVHAGNRPAATVSGLSKPQQFVGYQNMGLILDRVLPTFTGLDHVLLAGVSAGGFGAAANFERVSKAFGTVPVDLLDDSGPFMADPYAASCLQDQWRQLWGFSDTFLAACGADCPSTTNYLGAYGKHLATTFANRKLGLIESMDDATITLFFGFGDNNCTGFTQLTEATFTAGLNDIRTQLAANTNFGTFYFKGSDHTSLGLSAYDTRTAGTTKLSDWVTALVGGTVTNVGP